MKLFRSIKKEVVYKKRGDAEMSIAKKCDICGIKRDKLEACKKI